MRKARLGDRPAAQLAAQFPLATTKKGRAVPLPAHPRPLHIDEIHQSL